MVGSGESPARARSESVAHRNDGRGGRRQNEQRRNNDIPGHIWHNMSKVEKDEVKRRRLLGEPKEHRAREPHNEPKREHFAPKDTLRTKINRLASKATQEFLESQTLSEPSFYAEYHNDTWRTIPFAIRKEIMRQRAIKQELEKRAATTAPK